jgi:hypothetical protein
LLAGCRPLEKQMREVAMARVFAIPFADPSIDGWQRRFAACGPAKAIVPDRTDTAACSLAHAARTITFRRVNK